MDSGDFVLIKDDTMGSALLRAREYTPLSFLVAGEPIKAGIVCKFNSNEIVVTHDEIIPLCEIEDKITNVLTNKEYSNRFTAMNLEEQALSIFANRDELKAVYKSSKSIPASLFIYFCTITDIRYPVGFSELKFKLKDIINPDFGFYRK